MTAPSAFAVGSDFIQDGNLSLGLPVVGDITNTGGYTSISLINHAHRAGDIINDGRLWNESSTGSGIEIDGSQVFGSIRNLVGSQLSGTNAIRIVNASTVSGDILNDGRITGSYGTGVGLEVSGGSLVGGRIVNTGVLQYGLVVNDAMVAGGILNTGTIDRKSDDVALDVAGAVGAMTITNTGTIAGDVKLGVSTLNFDGGDITGAITGSGGTLNVNADFAPSAKITVQQVNVAAGKTLTLSKKEVKGLMSIGGTLAGSGDVGPTTLLAGSTLSPGTAKAPVGALTVNGDLTFNADSTYRVDATHDGKSDSVHAMGVANLAGSVLHVGSGGSYAAATSYTIVTADGGLNGKFDSLSSNLAYLDPKLAYQGKDVVLTVNLKSVPVDPVIPPVDNGGGTGSTGGSGSGSGGGTRPIEFSDLAVTGNQRSAAKAVQTLPTTSSLYSRVLNLPEGAPAGVFADLAGESFGSSVTAMQNVSNNVASLPTAQLRANMSAGWLPGPATAQVGRGDASTLPRSAAQPMWAQVFGNWRTMDGNDNVARTKETDAGVFLGGDHGIGNGWRLGGAFGYTDSRITVDDRSAKSDVNSYSAIIYGGKAFEAGQGKINVTAGLAYTWHDISSKRNINAAGERQELKADYSASTGQIFTDVGYAIPLTDRITLEPFVGADFSDLRTRGFSESGGDAALSGKSSTNHVGTTTLGLRAQTTFDVKETAGRLRGMLGWRHAYGDVNPEAKMSFDGSQPFTVAGTPLARDAAVMEVGVDLAMSKNATLGLAYSGQFGDGNRQNTGTVNVSWRF
ncbi:autotransporter outer membrane beta-barrel domain-containing protein [Achromobacter deleyi]|uniref:autotransporter family protein n=1 Tax=Achromobacter deleyi TaxID=1353891 RepID=UPI001491EE61|nr:autotransporter outer membrane beta-barrel domain-containing protein [Achromobacter deleyi]QVQ26092.1 autotransporter domain-containing protein [Achromobacter deleyi]UIP21652.1 autotransporter domain-containing protein [Achromobacter deleyi]